MIKIKVLGLLLLACKRNEDLLVTLAGMTGVLSAIVHCLKDDSEDIHNQALSLIGQICNKGIRRASYPIFFVPACRDLI